MNGDRASEPIWVVMRCRNDIGIVERTCKAVKEQRHPLKLLVMDNHSTDGSREVLEHYADRLIDVPEGTYVPGRVLNQAMRETTGEVVVFLNSDCPPLDGEWLEKLVQPFVQEKVCATFGCQEPRVDCWPLFAKDTLDTFGDGLRQKFWRHCFSMASSAIRRSVWEESAFREDIQYSEDIDWTWRQRGRGYRIQYVPQSRVEHSHNYTLAQFRKRQYGEGKADAQIFEWSDWESGWVRYSFLPFARQVLNDTKYCLRKGEMSSLFHSPLLRWNQMMGRRKGFLEGLESKRSRGTEK
ncbi:MAG: glycosyltransferase [Candidatus Sumerlaeia bacterium]|nr:glycosyltransferase [Candidatus Sumerlaeia bacterium]